MANKDLKCEHCERKITGSWITDGHRMIQNGNERQWGWLSPDEKNLDESWTPIVLGERDGWGGEYVARECPGGGLHFMSKVYYTPDMDPPPPPLVVDRSGPRYQVDEEVGF